MIFKENARLSADRHRRLPTKYRQSIATDIVGLCGASKKN